MIISRTPLRMSFVGGGTDLESYYRHEHGAIVSTTIDKYVYIMIDHYYDKDKIRLSYSRLEEVTDPDNIKHDIIREAIKLTKTPKGIALIVHSEVPSKGSGLGSSSTFTVGLLNALYSYQGKRKSAHDLAEEASRIEIDILKNPIGKQDQYAAAFGGFNYITFNDDGSVFVDPVVMSKKIKSKLQKNLIVFNTGITKRSNHALSHQKKKMEKEKDTIQTMNMMKNLTINIQDSLSKGDIKDFGVLLHKNWLLKKQLSHKISNPDMDKIYEKGLKAGAVGGKLLGAGGRGYMVFYCEKKHQKELRDALKDLRELEYSFEPEGSKIIYLDEK